MCEGAKHPKQGGFLIVSQEPVSIPTGVLDILAAAILEKSWCLGRDDPLKMLCRACLTKNAKLHLLSRTPFIGYAQLCLLSMTTSIGQYY